MKVLLFFLFTIPVLAHDDYGFLIKGSRHLVTLQRNLCYEVDMHLTTYCQSNDYDYYSSQLTLVSNNTKEYANIFNLHQFQSYSSKRSRYYKGSLYFYNLTNTTNLMLEKGDGCPTDSLLQFNIHYINAYIIECPKINLVSDMIAHMVAYMIAFTICCGMIVAACNDCNKKYR